MSTWNATFEAEPQNTDNLEQGDDEIRLLKVDIRARMENEHYTYNDTESDGTQSQDWEHKEGTAKAFYQASAPATKVNGNALDSESNGLLWIDSDTDIIYVRDATGVAWVSTMVQSFRISIQGALAAETNIVPPIVFPSGGTINKVSVRVGTAPVGAAITLDLNKYSTSEVSQGSIFDGETLPSIVAGDYHISVSDFHSTYGVLAADEYLTLDIDSVGSSTAGADLSLTIEFAVG